MRVLGIDFGTSNTVAMLRMPDGRVRPLLFDGSPLLPSSIYLAPDGRMLVGRDAERNARVDPTRFEPNPKRRIDDGTVFLGDQEIPVPKVFSYVLEQVLTEARRQVGGIPEQLRMTHPARWGERRRSLLVEAARLAGLPRPQLIPEPVGAASYFTSVLGTAVPVGRSLAIYDLGGGTFDATVVRRTQTGFEVLAEEGLPDVGGLDFDHAIVEHLGRTYQQSHPDVWAKLINPRDAGDRRYRRMLYEDVRGAKEMLSRTSSSDIHLPALEVDAHLTREELESLIRPNLERTVECLKRTLGEARLTPRDLVGIFLVGGSSRIPMAGHLIHTELGTAPTTLEQPETVVVEGAVAIGGGGPPAGQRPLSGPARVMPARPGPMPPPRPMPPPPRPVAPVAARPAPPQMRPMQAPMQASPMQARPMAPPPQQQQAPPPMPRPAPPRPAPPPPQPAPRPMQVPIASPPTSVPPADLEEVNQKRWHQEPAVVVTLIVAVLLVLGFVALLVIALTNS
jgi:molecular chaperone DnaK (HSP70)